MADSKHTRRALLGSALALILCFAMLLGTTFAWFTDTEKTTVNTIQAGTLDIELLDKYDTDLTKRPIKWFMREKDGTERQNFLWEPGASYTTETAYIVNKGNLALKYKIVINGIDAEALEAFDFSFLLGGDTISGNGAGTKIFYSVEDLENFEGQLLPESKNTAQIDYSTVWLKITAKMKPEAGNEYQGISLDGITVTVEAAQAPYEEDSLHRFYGYYDADATYADHSDPSNP